MNKMQHKDTPDNNETTFFDFTDENYARVDKIMAKYPANYRQASIIPLLDLAQRQARKEKNRRQTTWFYYCCPIFEHATPLLFTPYM